MKKKKNIKKGFTLVELLAVIVILAVIAIIAVPLVLNIISNSRKNIYERSTENILKTGEIHYFNKTAKGTILEEINVDTLEYKGKKSSQGKLMTDSNGDVFIIEKLKFNNYYCAYESEISNVIKCSLNEDEVYVRTLVANLDKSGASKPNLHENMIPIKWDGSKWVKADENNEDITYQWYDYNAKMWANAVTVKENGTQTRNYYKSAPLGTIIPEVDILTYMVWVPRYKYKLFNANNGVTATAQTIEIVFENKNIAPSHGGNTTTNNERRYETGVNGQYLTHPAFRFGSDELNGFWVGKFNASHETLSSNTEFNNLGCSDVNCANSSGLRIKPNVQTVRYNSVSHIFYGARSMSALNNNAFGYQNDNEVDIHLLKNLEWGAIAYLFHSKYGQNAEITINNSSTYITGCAGNSVSESEYEGCQNQYQTEQGQKASTTGNIYGVYDISSLTVEYVMGNMVPTAESPIGTLYPSSSGFVTPPALKYYDSYAYSNLTYLTHENGILGDATKETLLIFGTSYYGGWYDDNSLFTSNGLGVWFIRGGYYGNPTHAGAFSFDISSGGGGPKSTWRIAHR